MFGGRNAADLVADRETSGADAGFFTLLFVVAAQQSDRRHRDDDEVRHQGGPGGSARDQGLAATQSIHLVEMPPGASIPASIASRTGEPKSGGDIGSARKVGVTNFPVG